jgi:hypothetical protein
MPVKAAERSAMKLTLEIRHSCHDALFYHCMAHLDLVRDAANLHSSIYIDGISAVKRAMGIGATAVERDASLLTRLYQGTPDRISFQALPLRFHGPGALSEMGGAIHGRKDESGFLAAFLRAMEEEHQLFYESYWKGEGSSVGSVYAPFARSLGQEIPLITSPLFEALHLELHPCPAMRRSARALSTRDRSITIATGVPSNEGEQWSALFQVLHEATHSATDRLSGIGPALSKRDTRIESDGYRVHWLLEQVALAVDYHLVRRNRPALLDRYVRWSAGWVLPETGPDPVAGLRDRAEEAGVEKPSSDWQALAPVAPTDRLRAAEAALEELLLVPDSLLETIEAALDGRSSRVDRTEEE